jgi:hypothetical protein
VLLLWRFVRSTRDLRLSPEALVAPRQL